MARFSPALAAALHRRSMAGTSASILAVEFGTTRSSILGAIHRYRLAHGIPAQHPDQARRKASWSDESAAELMRRQAEGTSASIIAAEYGVTKA